MDIYLQFLIGGFIMGIVLTLVCICAIYGLTNHKFKIELPENVSIETVQELLQEKVNKDGYLLCIDVINILQQCHIINEKSSNLMKGEK
jgi:hypothetical protein